MKKRRNLCLFALIFLAAVIFCAGCGRRKNRHEGWTGYQIYYLDSSGHKLEKYEYETKTTDAEELAGELAGQMLTAPEGTDYQPVLVDQAELLDITQDGNILYLNFSKAYNSMDSMREILCRAAFAATMTQVDGVDFISINCEGQPKLDSQGNPMGVLGKSDFVESITNVNSYEKEELKLYFSNEDGTALVPETREVIHSANTSLERLIVEQLIEGPEGDDKNSVLPKDTQVLTVSVAENICYVNFDSSFLAGTLKTSQKLPIYAIVNSLTELQTVNRVQITVDGSKNVLYRDVVPLNEPFERDETFIQE